MKSCGDPLLCAPIKSRSVTLLSGPRYQVVIYRISKSLLVPLHTPDTSARDGMKSAPESKAFSPIVSPSIAKRKTAPLAIIRVTINPASHWAGSCRHKGEAEEKVNCWTLL